jgi:hypothetical protein
MVNFNPRFFFDFLSLWGFRSGGKFFRDQGGSGTARLCPNLVLYSVEVLFFANFTFNEFIEVQLAGYVNVLMPQNSLNLFLSDFMTTCGLNCFLS